MRVWVWGWLMACGATPASEPVVAQPDPSVRQVAPARLGSAPVCEPSALVILDDTTVLVGDNERHDALYRFDRVDGVLGGQQGVPVDAAVHDLEAMALHGDHVVLVGSHSHRRFRDAACPVPTGRRRMAVLERDGLRLIRRIETATWFDTDLARSVALCRTALFADSEAPLVGPTCQAFAAAEAEATSAQGSQGGINIEGAVALEDGRVWLGLRSPLVNGRAVMVRLAGALPDLGALRFDAVAHVPLDGMGIRGLARQGAVVYGIAGPVADGDEAFALWSTPVAALVPDAWPGVTKGPELPTSSEGLIVGDGKALVVIDGAEGSKGQPCRVAAGQAVVPLPVP